MSISIPSGYRFAGVHCGIKTHSNNEDLTLIVSDHPATAVGVFTKNRFQAASVTVNRRRTPSTSVRAIIANSGNANACTGQQGIEDSQQVTRCVADSLNVLPDQVLCLSTGIIGVRLPLEKITTGVSRAVVRLSSELDGFMEAARGIMTTDTRVKISSRTFTAAGRQFTVAGLAKGAAMIGPNMATMLAVIMTDAAVNPGDAHESLTWATDNSFNRISVEGHMSTNDTVLLLANGPPTLAISGRSLEPFRAALNEVSIDLAKAMPADGEGATHTIEIRVTGARTRADALRIAQVVADSPLVKTAIAGADPNWGRIISAVGYSQVDFDPARVQLKLNGHLLFRDLTPVKFDPEEVSRSIRGQRDTLIEIALGIGIGAVTFWTCDLTAEYVRLNADYHT